MSVCDQVDDIVWGETERVWDETFSLLALKTPNATSDLMNVVTRWLRCKIDEFELKYTKVSKILEEEKSEIFHYSEGVLGLKNHYQRIMLRYTSAYNACKATEYLL